MTHINYISDELKFIKNQNLISYEMLQSMYTHIEIFASKTVILDFLTINNATITTKCQNKSYNFHQTKFVDPKICFHKRINYKKKYSVFAPSSRNELKIQNSIKCN